MRDQQRTGGLTCTWVPVTDATGRTHMEAVWTPPLAASQPDAA